MAGNIPLGYNPLLRYGFLNTVTPEGANPITARLFLTHEYESIHNGALPDPDNDNIPIVSTTSWCCL
jgi:hypothetical protein